MVRRTMRLEYFAVGLIALLLAQIAGALTLSWTTVEISTTGNVGNDMALDKVSANTFVTCFSDTTNTDIKFGKTTTGGGTPADWTVSTVDATTEAGNECDIAVVDANTYVIAYHAASGLDLKVALTVNGGTSWAVTAQDTTGNVGSRPSIGVISPASWIIGYLDLTNGKIKRALTADTGTSYVLADVVTGATNNGQIGIEDATTFFFSYNLVSDNDLYAAVTVDGATSWASTKIDSFGSSDFRGDGAIRTAAAWYTIGIQSANPSTISVYKSENLGITWTETVIDSCAAANGIRLFGNARSETQSRLLVAYAKTDSCGAWTGTVPFFAQSDDSGGTWQADQMTGIGVGQSGAGHNIGIIGSGVYLFGSYKTSSSDAVVFKSGLSGAGPTATPTGDPIDNAKNFFSDAWDIDIETTNWLFGIGASGIIIFAFTRKGGTSPLIVGFAILLAVGLGVLLEFFPLWLLFMVIFIIIAIAGTKLFGTGDGGDE